MKYFFRDKNARHENPPRLRAAWGGGRRVSREVCDPGSELRLGGREKRRTDHGENYGSNHS